MEDLTICPLCKTWKEFLVETNCCSMKYCEDCLLQYDRRPCLLCKKRILDFNTYAIELKTNNTNNTIKGLHYSLYYPTKVLLNRCLSTCRYCEKLYTHILLPQHERECTMQPVPELYALQLGLESTKKISVGELRASIVHRNLYASYMEYHPDLEKVFGKPSFSLKKQYQTKNNNTTPNGEEWITHIVSDMDTLQGLALRYNCSVQDIKVANGITTLNGIYERSVIRVPKKANQNKNSEKQDEENAKRMESLMRKRLLGRFKKVTGCFNDEEAIFYLEDSDYKFKEALLQYKADDEWAKKNSSAFKPAATITSTLSTDITPLYPTCNFSINNLDVDYTNVKKFRKNRSCMCAIFA
eukprot:TRINITY_DN2476_c0_g1_i1.p1 TRINITY_DN2476_c0_g1~~TRINITY_DN2476_c0_g1_i1.p1  ORF type:complete len:355 (+),score=60.94 TRINITY_DN2476_c0_g1_i1:1104-2168(+)